MSHELITALSAFVGGGVGGLGSVWLSGRIADRAWRRQNRADHMKEWRAGLEAWEADPESHVLIHAAHDPGPNEITQQLWYASLHRHLSDEARAQLERPLRTVVVTRNERRSADAQTIQRELDRLERKWRLK